MNLQGFTNREVLNTSLAIMLMAASALRFVSESETYPVFLDWLKTEAIAKAPLEEHPFLEAQNATAEDRDTLRAMSEYLMETYLKALGAIS